LPADPGYYKQQQVRFPLQTESIHHFAIIFLSLALFFTGYKELYILFTPHKQPVCWFVFWLVLICMIDLLWEKNIVTLLADSD
jgi:hypothetical protein